MPERRGAGKKRAVALTAGALVLVGGLILALPQTREALPGKTADQVELGKVTAAAADLRAQNRELSARLAAPRPTPGTPAKDAQIADLRGQVEDLSAKLSEPPAEGDNPAADAQRARADDLKARLDAAQSGGSGDASGAEIATEDGTDAGQRARAEDLKGQLDAAQVRIGELADGSGDAGDGAVQLARANDLKAQLDAVVAKLQAPDPTPEPETVTASLDKTGIIAARQQFGLYTRQSPFNYSEFDAVEQAVDRDAQISGYFQDWSSDFRPDAVRAAWSRGQVPLLTWESQLQVGRVGPEQPNFSLGQIIDGRYDDYVRRYARDITATGLPLILRFDHEANGDWYPWAESGGRDDAPVNGNERGQYVQMWRHVHDIFQEEGANDYVVWQWAPNRVDRILGDRPVTDYYPGDDYVDLLGLSAYARPNYEDTSFDGVFAASLTALAFSDKPLVVSETGVAGTEATKVAYVKEFFERLPQEEQIAGFMWFNLAVPVESGTNDWRIDVAPATREAFGAGLAASGYGRPRTPVAQ